MVINWPLWQQGGMGVADPVQTAAYLKRTGLEALSSEQGLAVWNALMCDERAQTLVMSGRPSRVNALLDRIYRVPAPPPLPPGEGRREVDAFLGAIRQQVRYRAADLNGRQIETIRQLIKAELLGLHEAEK